MSVVVLRPSEGDGALSADWQQGAESSPPMDNDHNVTVGFPSLSCPLLRFVVMRLCPVEQPCLHPVSTTLTAGPTHCMTVQLPATARLLLVVYVRLLNASMTRSEKLDASMTRSENCYTEPYASGRLPFGLAHEVLPPPRPPTLHTQPTPRTIR